MASIRNFQKAVDDLIQEHQLYCSLVVSLIQTDSEEDQKKYALVENSYNETIDKIAALLANIKAKGEKNKPKFYRDLYEQIVTLCQENEDKLSQELGLDQQK